jgi:hypothetical protein
MELKLLAQVLVYFVVRLLPSPGRQLPPSYKIHVSKLPDYVQSWATEISARYYTLHKNFRWSMRLTSWQVLPKHNYNL